MSIDARVVGVRIVDGEHKLTLEARDAMHGPGQTTLVIENQPADPAELESFIGKELWGGSGELLVGQTVIAARTGYIGIRLVDGWQEILRVQAAGIL